MDTVYTASGAHIHLGQPASAPARFAGHYQGSLVSAFFEELAVRSRVLLKPVDETDANPIVWLERESMTESTDKNADPAEATKKLAELIKDIKIAMLTTIGSDQTLRSRPMATQQAPFDGELWFFARSDSAKAIEVAHDSHVNVSYAAHDDNRYVSISGRAQIVKNRDKAAELWNPIYRAWFPDGLDDLTLALIRVKVERAEYWDAPAGAMVNLVGFVNAIATGTTFAPGENREITF